MGQEKRYAFKLKDVAKSLRQVCFDVDKRITGQPEGVAEFWSKANSLRHAYTVLSIMNYAEEKRKDDLQILNASGLSCGHQDFSIATFLRDKTDIHFTWTAYESPSNEYLSNDVFKSYISDLQLTVRLCDYNKSSDIYGEDNGSDVVIFTEIAEHLDHSTLLKCLMTIRRKMKDNGIVIITTPNLVCLENRIMILFSNGDGPYWGDGKQNYEKGLYGHIVNYDRKRMERLLRDMGYHINNAFTFTSKPYLFTSSGDPKITCLTKSIINKLINLVLQCGNNLGRSLFIVAEKCSDYKEVPFQI